MDAQARQCCNCGRRREIARSSDGRWYCRVLLPCAARTLDRPRVAHDAV